VLNNECQRLQPRFRRMKVCGEGNRQQKWPGDDVSTPAGALAGPSRPVGEAKGAFRAQGRQGSARRKKTVSP